MSGIPYNMKQNVTSKWLQTLQSPFVHPSCHIPDDRTAVSGLVSSRETFTFSPTSGEGTSSTTHTSGIVFWPYPNNYRTKFVEQNSTKFGCLVSGVLAESANIPNFASMLPGGGTVRLVSLGLRVIYEGTELNRAGKIFLGTAGITSGGTSVSTVNAGVYAIEPLSVLTGNVRPEQTLLKSVLNNTITARISDGLFEANWIPAGVPSYQVAPSNLAFSEPFATPSASTNVASCFYNTATGGAGNESGQNTLVLIIEGDITASATVGNTYAIEAITHWEVIPVNPLAVSYDLTPSFSDFSALSRAMNGMSLTGGFKNAGTVSNLRSRGVSTPDFRPRQAVVAQVRRTKPASTIRKKSLPIKQRKKQKGGRA